jgi:hypothetical protein
MLKNGKVRPPITRMRRIVTFSGIGDMLSGVHRKSMLYDLKPAPKGWGPGTTASAIPLRVGGSRLLLLTRCKRAARTAAKRLPKTKFAHAAS